MAKKLIFLFRDYKRYSAVAALVFVLFAAFAIPQSAHAFLGIDDWCSLAFGDGNPEACRASGLSVASTAGYVVTWAADATLGKTYTGAAGIIFGLANLIFVVAGWIFDAAIGLAMTDPTKIAAVGVGWGIIRDVTNLFFIFIMLAISIATILRRESYGAKALLPRLIMVALLINFSMPISKVIIDINNVVAIKFYDALTTAKDSKNNPIKISSRISAPLGISTIFSDEALKKLRGDKNLLEQTAGQITDATFWTRMGNFFLGASLVLLITSFIFLAFSFFFIARMVALAFLLVLSPLAYLGMVLPYTAGHAKQWWEKFIKQSLVAPMGMMMLYVAITMATELGTSTTGASAATFAGILNGEMSGVSIILNFIIIIGVLIAALQVTQSLGAVGASTAISWGNAAYKGAKGYAGKQTYGRGAAALDKKYGETLRSKSPIIGGFLADRIKGVGSGFKKDVDARVGAVASMKDDAKRAEAMSNLSQVEQDAVWKKLTDQQKDDTEAKAGPGHTGMIAAMRAKDETRRKAAAEARAGRAIVGEAAKQTAAASYTPSSAALIALDADVTTLQSASGAAKNAEILKLANKLSGLGQTWSQVTKTLADNGSATAAGHIRGLNIGEKALFDAALKSMGRPHKTTGAPPTPTPTP